LKVFAEESPDLCRQREVVEQLVHEASGRLVITGEAGREIPWIKIAGLPSDADADWFLRLLRGSDRDVGEWLPCEHGDPFTVTIVMYRAQVSVEGYLRHLRRRLLQTAPALTIDSGADPVISSLPSPDPSPEELAGTIVRGLAAGAVTQSGELFSCADPKTGEVSLGENPAEVRRTLARSYVTCLRLRLGFVRALARRHDETLARLRALRARLAAGDGGALEELINEEAIRSVEQNARELSPHLKRLPGARV